MPMQQNHFWLTVCLFSTSREPLPLCGIMGSQGLSHQSHLVIGPEEKLSMIRSDSCWTLVQRAPSIWISQNFILKGQFTPKSIIFIEQPSFEHIGRTCLPSLEYNGTRWHLACGAQKKKKHFKNSTAASLTRKHYPVPQSDRPCGERFHVNYCSPVIEPREAHVYSWIRDLCMPFEHSQHPPDLSCNDHILLPHWTQTSVTAGSVTKVFL